MSSNALKNRIRSTKNIAKITRAMEAVSAVKMRRSVALALAGRPYALSALRLLEYVEKHTGDFKHSELPLLAVRPVRKETLVVITSDKGLAGSFNLNVLRVAENYLSEKTHPIELVTVGKKGRDYFRRKGELAAEFLGAGDFGTAEETGPIAAFVLERFKRNLTDKVTIIYTNFVSALYQETIKRTLLPFTEEFLKEAIQNIIPKRGKYANIPSVFKPNDKIDLEPLLEPSPIILLEKLLPVLLSIEVHSAIIEANASEHSSRMMAMRTASDNATELSGKLTIAYNKARQAQITKELLEITAGKEALET